MKILPEDVEDYRDRKWRREEDAKVETVADAERLIEELGFCSALTDARKALPSLFIAVCGRRDAFTPRNVQKDYEMDLTWTLKDEVLRRGRVYYGKVTKGQTLFIAPRLIKYFNAVFGVAKSNEDKFFSLNARKTLAVLRKEYEQASADLREETGIKDRKEFNKALDELQNRLKVVPCEVLYQPTFTYIWTLAEIRFPQELKEKVSREEALKEICRAYLNSAGQATSKDLAKNLGITPLEANLGNLLLVEEGFAEQIESGVFRLKKLAN